MSTCTVFIFHFHILCDVSVYKDTCTCIYIIPQLALGPQDFTILSTRLKDTFGDDKLIFGLEGGYDPERVAEAIVATLSPFFPSTTVQ